MSGTEQNKLDKLNARYKRQNDKIQKNYDRVSAVLPKGSTDRIKALGISTNQFINSAVSSELDKIEKSREKKFESPHESGGFRFMDWLDYVEERYGYNEVSEVKSPEERAILEADAEGAGVIEQLRYVWEHPEEYDPDRVIYLKLNPD